MGVKKFDLNQQTTQLYDHFDKINGQHPWQKSVPEGYILYYARKRHHGKVIYFNFELAKEMGLVPKDHPEIISAELETKLLDTFALQIINEYDIINRTPIEAEDIKPYPYMATRYLQLQHPSRTGKTSGDGRSIWNGMWQFKDKRWDISSCGTGATCLSPAAARAKKIIQTGDPSVSYGCGYSDVSDAMETAIFSDILHHNGTPTERSLCVIEFPKKLAINVRVSENLIRPSHLFNHLKQGNLSALQRAFDYYIDREIKNKNWQIKHGQNKYDMAVTNITKTFAQMAAHFEAEYLFCWLAWDGDNILLDGKIIDYGSIRQMGLFHHQYRFDDVERWSTNIKEQKDKALEIVQAFMQIVDFIKSGEKKPLEKFKSHELNQLFRQEFDRCTQINLLNRMGFSDSMPTQILLKNRNLVEEFQKVFTYFERTLSLKGEEHVPDGVNTQAVFCMRNLLREIPRKRLTAEEFVKVSKSENALKKDVKISAYLRSQIETFQDLYFRIVREAAQLQKIEITAMAEKLAARSDIINRYVRVTGDGICHTVEYILKQKSKMTNSEFLTLIKQFRFSQNRNPGNVIPTLVIKNKKIEVALKTLHRLTKKYCEDL